eukprot:9105194-Pyramimonas_sp.AAC.3
MGACVWTLFNCDRYERVQARLPIAFEDLIENRVFLTLCHAVRIFERMEPEGRYYPVHWPSIACQIYRAFNSVKDLSEYILALEAASISPLRETQVMFFRRELCLLRMGAGVTFALPRRLSRLMWRRAGAETEMSKDLESG